MERINLIRKVSEDGYKLLSVGSNYATYSDENGRVLLCIRGNTVEIKDDLLQQLAAARGSLSSSSTPLDASVLFHDLIHDSIAPITEPSDDEIRRRAPNFLSAFVENAQWRVATPKAIPAATDHVDLLGDYPSVSPATVYLRQRFPNLRLEWKIEHAAYELLEAASNEKNIPFRLTTSWQAYLRPGVGPQNANPLAACGSIVDSIVVRDGRPLIKDRFFVIERIISPDQIKPERLPLLAPESGHPGLIGSLLPPAVTTYVNDFIRESSTMLTSLLAISALLASLNPLLSTLFPLSTHTGKLIQIIVSSIGSACALLSMIVMVLGKIRAIMDGSGAFGALESLASGAAGNGGAEDARVSEAEIVDGRVLLAGESRWQDVVQGVQTLYNSSRESLADSTTK